MANASDEKSAEECFKKMMQIEAPAAAPAEEAKPAAEGGEAKPEAKPE